MFAFVLASMIAATTDPVPARVEAKSLVGQPTRICREMGGAASRSQAVIICRTKAQWQRAETCTGVTRYCAPKKVAMRTTAFPMNEDSRIVCRRMKGTGSRLSTSNVCMPLREWDRMWKDSQETVSSLQDRQSTESDKYGPR